MKEEKHITGAMRNCGYPSWTISKVKKMRATPKDKSNDKDTQNTTPTLSESFARLLKRHEVQLVVQAL